MNLNPEFKRNLWLETSPTRLLMMPLLLGLMVILCWVLPKDKPLEVLLLVAALLCTGLLIGWGSFLAISSINNEVAERTWDQQRLSALSPWEMAWGKLLGSTAYAWYGGVLCAGIIFIAALFVSNTLTYWTALLAGLIATLALHSTLMAGYLYNLDVNIKKTTKGFATSVVIFFILMWSIGMIANFSSEFMQNKIGRNGWWGVSWSYPMQGLLLACLFLGLGLLALWRSMSKQLMVRTTPWAWVLGIVCVGLIVAGFIEKAEKAFLQVSLLGILSTAILTAYGAICGETNNLLVWRTLMFHWENSSKRRFLQALPLWVVSIGLAFIGVALYSLVSLGDNNDNTTAILSSFLWLTLLHCLRDCGIYLFFAFRNTTKSPLGMTVLTLFILNGVLPIAVFAKFEGSSAQWFEPMYGLKNWFDSQSTSFGAAFSMGTSWASMLLHLWIVAVLVAWRWSKIPKST